MELQQRSGVEDAYVFINDGVYVCLSGTVAGFGDHKIYVFEQHLSERGLSFNNTSLTTQAEVELIAMADLVRLTAAFSSSMSW